MGKFYISADNLTNAKKKAKVNYYNLDINSGKFKDKFDSEMNRYVFDTDYSKNPSYNADKARVVYDKLDSKVLDREKQQKRIVRSYSDGKNLVFEVKQPNGEIKKVRRKL